MSHLIHVAPEHVLNARSRGPLVKSLNQAKLLSLIQEQGPISRATLAKLSRLSKPTVSNQVDSLIRQGWVAEHGTGESSVQGGKKPTLVQFNADAGRLVAVEIHTEQVKVRLADLNGTVLKDFSVPTPADRSAGKVLLVVKAGMRKVLAGERETRPNGCVVAVAAPGRVDINDGAVLQADQFRWKDVRIRRELEKAFGLPVFVDNSVNMAALGEKHHGAAIRENNFVVVRLDSGIGCGIFIGGRLYHGSQFGAGEIAHMIVEAAHADDEIGPRGFLESMVGSDLFEMQVRALTGRSSDALESLKIGRQDRGALRHLYDQFAHYMGAAVANLVCAYDPSMIVLEGPLFEPILDEVDRVLARALPWRPEVRLSNIHDDAVLMGTVIAARAKAYERIGNKLNDLAGGRVSDSAS